MFPPSHIFGAPYKPRNCLTHWSGVSSQTIFTECIFLEPRLGMVPPDLLKENPTTRAKSPCRSNTRSQVDSEITRREFWITPSKGRTRHSIINTATEIWLFACPVYHPKFELYSSPICFPQVTFLAHPTNRVIALHIGREFLLRQSSPNAFFWNLASGWFLQTS